MDRKRLATFAFSIKELTIVAELERSERIPPENLNVSLGDRSYPILVGERFLEDIGEMVVPVLKKVAHAVCIVDASIAGTHGQQVAASLQRMGIRTSFFEVASGEESKSVPWLTSIWKFLLESKTDRGSVLFAVGGGVVGDLAGFAAASYVRGIRLVQIPTTLLAQVDSSVGGKTGINLPEAKNIIGAFWQPSMVLIDTDTLATLQDREFRSGLAEVVKYGMIMDPRFFDWLEENADAILKRQPNALRHVILQSCRCKAEVVASDERETTGRRAILNYGHTFGHAFEAATHYGQLLHGEAVSIGMMFAAKLACHMGRIDRRIVDRQEKLLHQFRLPTSFPGISPDHLWELMQNDKKVQHGSLSFVLPSRLGQVELVSGVDRSLVLEILDATEG